MSISRAKCSGIFPASRSAQEEFETFIYLLPPSSVARDRGQVVGAVRLLYSSPDPAARFLRQLRGQAPLSENNKPTVGLVTEVGFLRSDLSFPYSANPAHSGALL